MQDGLRIAARPSSPASRCSAEGRTRCLDETSASRRDDHRGRSHKLSATEPLDYRLLEVATEPWPFLDDIAVVRLLWPAIFKAEDPKRPGDQRPNHSER